jgi:hypothetical protein
MTNVIQLNDLFQERKKIVLRHIRQITAFIHLELLNQS